ncbi:hypothetical protein [Actinomadura sp. WMMB 499]|uniref:hypothetical protein n=1 Tax=Actinomadura sp. WMMB 499 TaxID=1219491 RepID=UPI00159D3017|nr:hypothetical protein [Actinomadura sp. WMMB 499]
MSGTAAARTPPGTSPRLLSGGAHTERLTKAHGCGPIAVRALDGASVVVDRLRRPGDRP